MSLLAKPSWVCRACLSTAPRIASHNANRIESFSTTSFRPRKATKGKGGGGPGEIARKTEEARLRAMVVDVEDDAPHTPKGVGSRSIPREGDMGMGGKRKPPSKGPAKAGLDARRILEPQDKFHMLKRLVLARFDNLCQNPFAWPGNAIPKPAVANLFKEAVVECCNLAGRNITSRRENPLFWNIRTAFVRVGTAGIDREVKYEFRKFQFNLDHGETVTARQLSLANFHNPEEWYPATRSLQRTIHLHVGPTNSGKTYHALQALSKANSGIYAGPLRLLAHEVFTRFNNMGIPAALVTGEEQRFPDADNYLVACTVEMSPLNQLVDIAVIDEIQMITDDQRGWAWTAAFLGMMAKEVHLCGEERTVKLIETLCAKTGEELIVHRYTRLNSLSPMDISLSGNFNKLEKGDAIVSFSRVGLWALKQLIEKNTGRRCAIVYGGLPPEVRAQQAALFNDPNNDYDFIAASDAIGMGLNLSIKRVIFETTLKHDGTSLRRLTVPEIKQIGGRAGRFRTAAQQGANEVEETQGFVGVLEDKRDLNRVKSSINKEPPQIESACISLPVAVVERFAKYFPPTVPLTDILLRLRDICSTSAQFHLCALDESVDIAELLESYALTISEKMTFLSAPINTRDNTCRKVIKALASAVAKLKGGHFLEITDLPLELLEEQHPNPGARFLGELESLHRAIGLFLWLSYRFPSVISGQAVAFHTKTMLEDKINDLLSKMRYDEKRRKATRQAQSKQVDRAQRRKKAVLGETDEEVEMEERGQRHEVMGVWNEDGHEEPVMENLREAEDLIVRRGKGKGKGKGGKLHPATILLKKVGGKGEYRATP